MRFSAGGRGRCAGEAPWRDGARCQKFEDAPDHRYHSADFERLQSEGVCVCGFFLVVVVGVPVRFACWRGVWSQCASELLWFLRHA